MNMMYTLGQDSYGQPKVRWSCAIVIQQLYLFVTVPNTSVQAEVFGERINLGSGYGLEIRVSYHFYGNKKGVN